MGVKDKTLLVLEYWNTYDWCILYIYIYILTKPLLSISPKLCLNRKLCISTQNITTINGT